MFEWSGQGFPAHGQPSLAGTTLGSTRWVTSIKEMKEKTEISGSGAVQADLPVDTAVGLPIDWRDLDQDDPERSASDPQVALPSIETGELNGGGPVPVVSRFLQESRMLIRKAHDEGASGRFVTRLHAETIDQLLGFLVTEARKTVTEPPLSWCLMAIGGYGRNERSPLSDIDIQFVGTDKDSGPLAKLVEKIVFWLWDLKFEVGYSVRRITECEEMVRSDETVRTALCASRFLEGDPNCYRQYESRILQKVLREAPDKFVERQIDLMRQRHEKFGDSVFLLEPNVKEGRGGLRDIQVLSWLSFVKFGTHTLKELAGRGFLNQTELVQLQRAYDFMLRTRNELHYLSGSGKSDRLGFELQEGVARYFGFSDKDGRRGVERFMRRFYLMANTVNDVVSRTVERIAEYGRTPTIRSRLKAKLSRPKDIADGIHLVNGELSFTSRDVLERRPEAMIEIFRHSQLLNKDVSRVAKEMIYLNSLTGGADLSMNQAAQYAFRDLFTGQTRLHGILKDMHMLRLLSRVLPEWRTIACHVQHDAYHVYTTDVHTLFCMKDLRHFTLGHYRQDYPELCELAQSCERPHVLSLGLFFHDIGKNMGGNHAVKGAAKARAACSRMGLPPQDVDDIEWLVLKHLDYPHVALKRDINDPHQISLFAAMCGRREMLDMLYVLTVCDIRGTGPDLWTEWKHQLTKRLHDITAVAIDKGRYDESDVQREIARTSSAVLNLLHEQFSGPEVETELGLFPTRYFFATGTEQIAEHVQFVLDAKTKASARGDENPGAPFRERSFWLYRKEIAGTPYTEVAIFTLDAKGLFAKVTGVFSAAGLSILTANINTRRDGTVFDVFWVRDPYGKYAGDPKRWDRLETMLDEAITGRRRVASMLTQSQQGMRSSPIPFQIPVKIKIDNDSSREHTIIDITAGDRLGLLHAVAQAMTDLGLSIHLAKITTKKERVDDAFYVTDIFGHKIRDQKRITKIMNQLKFVLEDSGGQGGEALGPGLVRPAGVRTESALPGDMDQL